MQSLPLINIYEVTRLNGQLLFQNLNGFSTCSMHWGLEVNVLYIALYQKLTVFCRRNSSLLILTKTLTEHTVFCYTMGRKKVKTAEMARRL